MKTLDKTTLRKQMRALRRELAAETPDASERLFANFPRQWLIEQHTPDFYSLYYPMGSELDPRGLFLNEGSPCLPVAIDRDEALAFRVWEREVPLQPDAFGIPAPPPSAETVSPDIILAPVLAFDMSGARLGQGAGHYDRTIANLRAAKPVWVIGVAYAGQQVDELPMEPHDQRLDAILTETGYHQFG